MAFDIVEQGNDTPLLMSKHGIHGYDGIEHRELPNPMGEEFQPITVLIVTVDGEEYIAEDLPKVRCTCASVRNGALLRAWASRHYILDGRSQRAYIARAMGACLDILLVKASLACIPSNLNDMVCLMTIAARRVTKKGNQVELIKPASRRHILEEMESLLEFKRNEIKEDAEKALKAGDKKEKPMSKKNTFSSLSFQLTDTQDFTVTGEEITIMNCLLQRVDEAIMYSLLTKSLDILNKAETRLEEDEEERRAFHKAPSDDIISSLPDVERECTIFSFASSCLQVDPMVDPKERRAISMKSRESHVSHV